MSVSVCVDGSLLTQLGVYVCVREEQLGLINIPLLHGVLQIVAQSATIHNNIQFTL